MNWQRVLDLWYDVVHIVLLAALLAFVVFAATRGAGEYACAVVCAAYVVGRWHAGKAWRRDLELLRQFYEQKGR